jgi:di/tricarboxylate transporter
MAYASGQIKSAQMIRSGLMIGITALILTYVLIFILKMVHFI